LGVLPTQEGMKIAKEAGLDLVEVAPNSNPPVCRIMDYSKYKYEQSKKEKLARKKQKAIEMKEIKLKPNIEEHDYQVKLKHIQRFLKKGHRVKVTLTFRGREIVHPDLGRRILERLTKDIALVGQVVKEPTIETRFLVMIIDPK
jgi:translation initiation factor IF-3